MIIVKPWLELDSDIAFCRRCGAKASMPSQILPALEAFVGVHKNCVLSLQPRYLTVHKGLVDGRRKLE
jgi:hypothetical protein